MSKRCCFYCANTHNFTEEPCTCACHDVEQLHDSLKAINPDVDWTIPQLYAVKKLLTAKVPESATPAPAKATRDEAAYWRSAYEQLLEYVKSENSCSVCHKFANPLYMCDEDTHDNKYCSACFTRLGCEREHEEDCMSTVSWDGPQGPIESEVATPAESAKGGKE